MKDSKGRATAPEAVVLPLTTAVYAVAHRFYFNNNIFLVSQKLPAVNR